ncbi:hypothetical protein CERSUDRAFT_82772 [Gelatoporia subvermispora B]|uniref:Uncharacterized protein n=1 Tax=Ceriporiopsis subvermispora (strain B) TaxID=914234 RepID=M2PPR3_CERS8|nr:hypothetical protein CERSUDRAFT_82772 [Gelatoporia subvermispora B]
MDFNTHDNIVLVAPRPVRLATLNASAPYPQFNSVLNRPHARAPSCRIVEEVLEDKLNVTEPQEEPVSPRASPRSNLPSEAVEEFLSILNSTAMFFPPTSPVLRPANANMPPHYFTYRRPNPSSISPSLPEGLGLTLVDRGNETQKENDPVPYPFKLLGANALASPVSRVHTRNPFQRHPSYETAIAGLLGQRSPVCSPAPMASTLSPAAIPLPLPTPDEMEMDPIS